jgi:myo-inositol-1-phosphate synthase
MSERRVGIWFIGAWGGVAATAALGLSALTRRLTDTTSLVTATPLFDGVDLDHPVQFTVGGHDIRRSSYVQAVRDLHQRSKVFDTALIESCRPDLELWDKNIRGGTILGSGATISKMADWSEVQGAQTPRQAISRIQHDLRDFKAAWILDQVVVANVSSTEPPFTTDDRHDGLATFEPLLDNKAADMPASSLYAWAALDLGWPFINFTPSLGASFPAAVELAQQRGAAVCGQDGKTGETMLKSVLAPMFAIRNLRVLSWVGHNIFGNRDGLVLDDPANKESKIRTKDQLIGQIVGYKPQTHVSIEYIPSLDDWKTAWDHIHFQGFLGTKMILQFIWQGCDSLLAAPLVIDLARLTLLAQRRGESGVLTHLACFFKSPLGVREHDFSKQYALLEEYARQIRAGKPS